MASKFTLKGRELEISCTLGAGRGFPILHYRNGTTIESFGPEQIHIDESMLGQLLTVTLDLAEAGATTFSLILPSLDIPLSDSIDFTTMGIYKEQRGPVIVPKRLITQWRTVHLYGIAQTVLVANEHAEVH